MIHRRSSVVDEPSPISRPGSFCWTALKSASSAASLKERRVRSSTYVVSISSPVTSEKNAPPRSTRFMGSASTNVSVPVATSRRVRPIRSASPLFVIR